MIKKFNTLKSKIEIHEGNKKLTRKSIVVQKQSSDFIKGRKETLIIQTTDLK